MKRFIGWVVVSSLACGAPPPEVVAADDTAQSTAELQTPQAKCKVNAEARRAAWKAAGVPAAEIERRINLALSSCADATVDSATAVYLGAVNTDLERLARMITAQTLTPEQYIHRMRDRVRKARRARHDAGLTADWLAGDVDNDLVPNKVDHCPDTPDLAPTGDDGCAKALAKLNSVPDAEKLHQVLGRLGIVRSRACDGAPVPEVPTHASIERPPTGGGGLYLVVPRIRTQPVGCLVFYEIEAHESTVNGATPMRAAQRFVLRDTEATLTHSSTLMYWFANPSTGQKELFRAKAAAGWDVRLRLRAVNANGQASGWSTLSQ